MWENLCQIEKSDIFSDQTNRPCCLDIDFSCEDMAKMGF